MGGTNYNNPPRTPKLDIEPNTNNTLKEAIIRCKCPNCIGDDDFIFTEDNDDICINKKPQVILLSDIKNKPIS